MDRSMDNDLSLVAMVLTSPFVDDGLFRRHFEVSVTDARAAELYCKLAPAMRPSISVLFDASFYMERNPDAYNTTADGFLHFVMFGVRRRWAPHPLIDLGHIREQQPGSLPDAPTIADLWRILEDNLVDPSPYFSLSHYKSQLRDVIAHGSLLKHFLREGLATGLRPNRFLDPIWYCNQLPSGHHALSAIRHFVLQGDREGRPPSEHFDSQHYLRSHPDVAAAGMPPLLHYLTRGIAEGRTYRPLSLQPEKEVASDASVPNELYSDETIWRDARTFNYLFGTEATWAKLAAMEREDRLRGNNEGARRAHLTATALRLLHRAWSGQINDLKLVHYLTTRGYAPADS
jgi:hypothetical protein